MYSVDTCICFTVIQSLLHVHVTEQPNQPACIILHYNGVFRLVPVYNIIFSSKTDILSKIAFFKLYLE